MEKPYYAGKGGDKKRHIRRGDEAPKAKKYH